jgi:spermidine/putrescine transport system substrate-binding protein
MPARPDQRGDARRAARVPALLPLALALALLAATGARAQAADRAITVYMYSEYIDPAIPKAFEAKTGIHVLVDVYEAQEEMLAKMRAGGASQYDVLVASDVVVAPLIALKLVRPLDPARLTHRGNLDPRWRAPAFDPQDQYCVPYQWGTVGLMYRADRVKAPITWAMVFDPAKGAGPFVLMDEQRSQIAVALRYLGKPLNSRDPQDLAAAGKLLASAKASPDCLGFDGGVAGKNKVLSGEAALAVVYNGDAVKAMTESKEVAFAVPSEGTMVSMDNMLVCSGSHDPEAAERFIDEILDARVGAQLSNYTRYATPNKAALDFILPADRANPAIYPPPALWPALASLTDLGPDQRLYDEVWTAVKAR